MLPTIADTSAASPISTNCSTSDRTRSGWASRKPSTIESRTAQLTTPLRSSSTASVASRPTATFTDTGIGGRSAEAPAEEDEGSALTPSAWHARTITSR
ncbi:hypothetical protein A7K94_0216890 [Modestobacter sp. VKM Ac-2676]|nr:hypothetical protein A7K94_0216890 [Modestobacter sp. VKM Ac-2676]